MRRALRIYNCLNMSKTANQPEFLARSSWRNPNPNPNPNPRGALNPQARPFNSKPQHTSWGNRQSNFGGGPSNRQFHNGRFRPQEGGKRKWEGNTRPPPSQRRRFDKENRQDLKDEAYVRRTFKLPSPSDYKGAPESLFTDPREAFRKSTKKVLRMRLSFSRSYGAMRCNIHCGFLRARGEMNAVGEGANKTIAEKAAYLHLLAQLHEAGILKEIFEFADINHHNPIYKEDDSAIEDVVNYAARFDAIPSITYSHVNTPFDPRSPWCVEYSIELPEHKIHVRGRHQSYKMAQVGAAVRFKQEAEKFQSELGTESLALNDSQSLTVQNAKTFLEYYRIVYTGTKIDNDAKDIPKNETGVSVPLTRWQCLMNGQPFGDPFDTYGKKNKGQDISALFTAVALKKKDPELYPKFLEALKEGNGAIVRPMPPVDFVVEQDCLISMRETLYEVRKAGLPDEREEAMRYEGREYEDRYTRKALSPNEAKRKSEKLKKRRERYLKDPELESLRSKREGLPMNQYHAKVLDMVNQNVYSIVVGATGSGKTTQTPQIVLDDAISRGEGAQCNIICTQPRRIAATSVARRVAEERNESLGKSVGYQVRFDRSTPEQGGSITYCTTGILLQQLQNNPDSVFDHVSHLFVDEVHERDILIDFLMILLKGRVKDRVRLGKPVPRVVLMSATLDTELFAGYFKQLGQDGQLVECPTLSVPGRTFPVSYHYLDEVLGRLQQNGGREIQRLLERDPQTREHLAYEESFKKSPLNNAANQDQSMDDDEPAAIDWKRKYNAEGEVVSEKEDALVPSGLVAATIGLIARDTNEGAILVFLPGLEEILKVENLLRKERPLGINVDDSSKYRVSLLHSSLPSGQTDVFSEVPEGCRKIILATNIAETSITIPDVQYVIDSGKLREKRYDQLRRITRLQCCWVSKSNSRQRAGRAGRVRDGNYYALFTKERYESLRSIGLPEMLRSDLQEVCLDVKAHSLDTNIDQFLSEAIEPPAPEAVAASVRNLRALEALTDDEMLTPLGRLLASLPVHPNLGKMMVLAVVFRCLDPMLVLGALASDRGIFVSPLGKKEEAAEARRSFAEGTGSDHIGMINAFRELRWYRDNRTNQEAFKYAEKNFIHYGAFRSVENTVNQIEDVLVQSGLIPKVPAKQRTNSEVGTPSLNQNSANVPLLKAIALAGMGNNIGITGGRGTKSWRTESEKTCFVHPSSINHVPFSQMKKAGGGNQETSLMTYSTLSKSTDAKTTFLRDTTLITPLAAALFGGRLTHAPPRKIQVGSWLPFWVKTTTWSSDGREAKTIFEFRKALDRLLAGAFADIENHKLDQTKFLHENQLCELFAQGLVDVLDKDIPTGKYIERKWRKSATDAMSRLDLH
ncbi:P-loop containing nucleoside triphosphate hydrolase protein [Xylona heveae TC161]|uniref:RNA helicase n=1 Tax=Xylona heveae (strain CBS 132557 / TC161) TaxID=1328760 RepID=A0A165GZM4_XYLHT|nr:P-loop containing nucleoside triphosphate hydrolase protein [Xylona heveae TC161]KZF22803.1 P-loop containing nucleoside triphosphate hydrolase protein [Xylona heveae TC161]